MPDFVALQSYGSKFINNAHFLFRAPGNPLLWKLMEGFVRRHNPKDQRRQAMAPVLWTSVLAGTCANMNTRSSPGQRAQAPPMCTNVSLLPFRRSAGMGITGVGLFLRSVPGKPDIVTELDGVEESGKPLAFYYVNSFLDRAERTLCQGDASKYAKTILGRARARHCPVTFAAFMTDKGSKLVMGQPVL
mmetsp:Transcript_17049/g.57251  ORF Transcript_17049/g.57251 Transcript_17049/m.57251 type:complete len:189 (+) Transcript_17049:644-1210(+)